MTDEDPKVRISEDNWRRLNAMKRPGDTFDDVVNRLLDANEEQLFP